MIRYINFKSGSSPSYLKGNLVNSNDLVAFVKNTTAGGKVFFHKYGDLQNESLPSELLTPTTIEWENKECTHINMVKLGDTFYLVLGFVGYLQVYNEDGSKRYLEQ
jgi:hypothetical protein